MRFLVVILLILIPASALLALDANVTITDKDLGTPLEGVKITGPGNVVVNTDADGKAAISIPGTPAKTRLVASLIGYDNVTFFIKAGDSAINLQMSISNVVEGKELVVEQAKPAETDEQSGVSQVATHDQIKNSSDIGPVEDVMSTVETLPGVIYGGKSNAQPSVRGGSPNETRAVLDGAYVFYPYQWGGAFSIFDPNFVDSAKLSNGIISARYGDVMSGMLEVTSRTPVSDEPEVNISLSTTEADIFALVPFGDKAGLLIDGKVTWIGLVFPLLGQVTAGFNPAPFIQNGYARFYWKPTNQFEWDLNYFLGNDGVGFSSNTSAGQITSTNDFTYDNLSMVTASNMKFLLNNNTLLTFTAAWNRLDQQVNGTSDVNGTETYDQNFETKYASILNNVTSANLDDISSNFVDNTIINTLQGKLNLDLQVAPGHLLSFGAETLFQNTDSLQTGTNWVDMPNLNPTQQASAPYIFEPQNINLPITGNRSLTSGLYGLYQFDFWSGLLTGEAGVRIDHVYLWNDSMSLNTYPVVNPRLLLTLTPLRNTGGLTSLSFSLGSGLYSQVPYEADYFTANQGLTNFGITPNRAWFNVLGVEMQTDDGWKVSLEGYYKYYFNRIYVIENGQTNPVSFSVKNDGTGRSIGFDVMIQKRLSRYWDGWLTYSYNDVRLQNPTAPSYSGETDTDGDPLGMDYYPSYQLFHTLNLISDWKPVDGFSVYVKATIASGTPIPQVSTPPQFYISQLPNGQYVERFTRTSVYSDTDRTGWAFPIDIKLTWSGYFDHSKVGWEFYIAAQDVLALFYAAGTNDGFDPFTGKTFNQTADFNLGFPLPSFGFKLSF